MKYLLGIDVGTSGTKAIIIDETGKILNTAYQEYKIDIPAPGLAEQNPLIWWNTTKNTIKQLLSDSKIDKNKIAGIGLSGQMHSTVFLDKNIDIIRPAIIWADQRSKPEAEYINRTFGKQKLAETVGNRAATGFMASTVLWIKKHEKDTYKQIYKVILPKDYIRLKLTGKINTDVTDASSTLLFDIKKRKWCKKLITELKIKEDCLPLICESAEIAGEITKAASRETGLPAGIPVIAGGGDQPVSAVGNGIIYPDDVLITIGTGGQVFTPLDKPIVDPQLRTHTFCHAISNKWFIMGAMLCAGLCLKWFKENVLLCKENYNDLSTEAEQNSPAGSNGLIFLPYLTGERTPHFDPDATGIFYGVRLNLKRSDFIRAIMEGVTFGLRNSLDIFNDLKIKTNKIIISGGGSNSNLWQQIQADIFNEKLYKSSATEQACFGAALLAGLGTKVFKDVEYIVKNIINYKIVAKPNTKNVKIYNKIYKMSGYLYELELDFRSKIK